MFRDCTLQPLHRQHYPLLPSSAACYCPSYSRAPLPEAFNAFVGFIASPEPGRLQGHQLCIWFSRTRLDPLGRADIGSCLYLDGSEECQHCMRNQQSDEVESQLLRGIQDQVRDEARPHVPPRAQLSVFMMLTAAKQCSRHESCPPSPRPLRADSNPIGGASPV